MTRAQRVVGTLAITAAIVLVLTLLSGWANVSAANFTVTVTTDSADGVCDGHCSLREAVMAANANISTIDTITIPAGTYTLGIGGAENALNPAAQLDLDLLNNNTTINGAGASSTIIDANYIDRVFEVHLNKVATFNNLTIQHGAPIGQGGGLTAAGGSSVTLSGVVVANNQANDGGGIWNGGTMLVGASTVRDNVANNGGGIFNGGSATLSINQSTLSGNQAGGAGGGGLYNDNNASLSNTTITNNIATNSGGGGGGILNYNTTSLNLQNVTLSNNSSSSGDKGGGIRNFGSTGVWNSIIANNSGGGGNCSPVGVYSQVPVASYGDNIDWGAANCGFGAVGDMIADPNLGPLQNNGGPTETRAILSGSAAIDTETHGGNCFPTDQRAVARPQGPACDIGAYEAAGAAPTPTATPAPTPAPTSDDDGDGFTYSAEGSIGTNPADPCGSNAWPADLSGTDNRLNIADFNSFIFPLRPNGSFNKISHPVPDPDDGNIARWNLDQAGGGAAAITIADLNALNPAVNAPTSRPPMFGGLPAFFTNGGLCPFPP
jgi:CSLREA domain-containing protein